MYCRNKYLYISYEKSSKALEYLLKDSEMKDSTHLGTIFECVYELVATSTQVYPALFQKGLGRRTQKHSGTPLDGITKNYLCNPF